MIPKYIGRVGLREGVPENTRAAVMALEANNLDLWLRLGGTETAFCECQARRSKSRMRAIA